MQMICLNKNNLYWEYEPKTFKLSDGSAYTPDFYLIDTDEYIEIKGWLHSEWLSKYIQFQKEYSNVRCILKLKHSLEHLGINLKEIFISTRPKFKCEQCGKEFHRKHKTMKTCSTPCRNRYIAIHRKKRVKINVVNEIHRV